MREETAVFSVCIIKASLTGSSQIYLDSNTAETNIIIFVSAVLLLNNGRRFNKNMIFLNV